MAARSKARKRALDILFESEIRGEPVLPLLDERTAADDPPVAPYAGELVRGVYFRRDQIDELLAEHAQGWTLERMPAVDRNILRIGTFELLWQDEVPDAVAISEAVQLARDLSTDGSPSFVNGLLARLLELKPDLLADSAASPGPARPGPVDPETARLGLASPGAAEDPGASEAGVAAEPEAQAVAVQKPGAESAS